MRHALLSILLLAGWLHATAQPLCRVTFYDEDDGVPSSHITQLLQDNQGFMWFATWNGLCRYDGYDFQTFKPQAGDSCQMMTDRIRDIGLCPDGQILCRVDDDFFLFNSKTCRFSNSPDISLADDIQRYRQSQSLKQDHDVQWEDAFHTHWTLASNGQLTYQTADGQQGVYPQTLSLPGVSFACIDRQRNLWVITGLGICKLTTDLYHTERLPIEPQAEVKCLFSDSRQHYWVATRDAAVRLYATADDTFLGYLGADGRLHRDYTRFPAPVYCMLEQADGTLWLGTKPDGLYRLRPSTSGTYDITHHTNLPDQNVYHLLLDRFGRLWVATLGGGICYSDDPHAPFPHFQCPASYPKEYGQRIRFLSIARHDILMAATTDGLMLSQLQKDADRMRFVRHRREPERATSLSSSAVTDVLEKPSGQVLVSTESGGVNMTEEGDLLAEHLTFTHFNVANHQLTSDIALSMTAIGDDTLMIVSNHLLTLLDQTGHRRVLDARYFNADYRFSEARPLSLPHGRWLFGLSDGAFFTSTRLMYRPAYTPPIVLTGVSIQGTQNRWDVTASDTLTLKPDERSLTIHFAALDFAAPERISYAFRVNDHEEDSNDHWNHIGKSRSVTLLDLHPGTYLVEVRSTNADGEWTDNVQSLTLIVKPTFWESVWGRLLLFFLALATLAMIGYTIYYIRQMKHKQHEMLAAYLTLLENKNQDLPAQQESPAEPVADTRNALEQDPMLQRVRQFIEENISNSDANVGDMAAAAAVSRSGLQRKLKQTMGITPLDLLREARIKHACLMLRQTDKNISEVAYACGFTDPKYFSRCFRQSTGCTPSEYKNAQQKV